MPVSCHLKITRSQSFKVILNVNCNKMRLGIKTITIRSLVTNELRTENIESLIYAIIA